MKSLVIAALCAVTFTARAQEAKRDTIDKYIIDKEVVAHFDGSQLEGKCISKYMIAYKESGDVVVKNHVIHTEGGAVLSIPSIVEHQNPNAKKGPDPLIIVDGKETSKEDFGKINSAEIANITVFKPESAVKIWGSKGSNGVIQVTTKANYSTEATQSNINEYLIIVDGQEISLEEFNKMKPKSEAEYAETFASMSVLKAGSEAAKSYGEKGRNGVIVVTTKKGKKK